ncbi:MAG TPA: glutamate synthase, partial [Mariprofundaceae bacterium]|nr:glutamate synthase [Mariprofundaceae bacterium]
LANFFNASTELMQVMTRACGHHHFNQLTQNDLATWHREMALLSGIKYSGVKGL